MLTEKEFVETYTTTESKIKALYSAIVDRVVHENELKELADKMGFLY